MQVFNPRWATLLPKQLVSALPRQVALLPSQAGIPQPGRNTGSAGTKSHTGSASSQAFSGSSPQAGSFPLKHLGSALPRQGPQSSRNSPHKEGKYTGRPQA